VPGRVTTSIGRKWPSQGAIEPPASIEIAIREADTVDGSGQLIGPSCCGGASLKSRRTPSEPMSTTTSNGTGRSVIPSESISPWAT
jgi:hypothetical protein